MSTVSGNTNQDVELMYPGLRLAVTAGPDLRASKWFGGLWVKYIQSTEGDFVVEQSDGEDVAGFLLFPSENYSFLVSPGPNYGSNANYTSAQPATGVGGQNVVTMISDNTRAFFRHYETISLVGGVRNGPPIVYAVNEVLYISENGLLTNDSIAELNLVGIANPVPVGIVSAIPAMRNASRLGADLHF